MEHINMRDTVAPKSDQLNSDDLIGTTKTIKITSVKHCGGDQPIAIHFDGDNGKPYKPCKSMRRVLIHAWGDNGADYVGKSLTLYCDPEVKFGGIKVGGIRISHMSDITRAMDIALTATRGKRTPYRIEPLKVQQSAAPAQLAMLADDDFEKTRPRMLQSLAEGKTSIEKIRAYFAGKGYQMTADQESKLSAPADVTNEETF